MLTVIFLGSRLGERKNNIDIPKTINFFIAKTQKIV